MHPSDTDLFLCISRYFSEKLFFEILSRRPHCAKSVRIRSYSGSYFPTFGLNTDRYGVSLRIQSECRKIRTRITPNTDTFHAVLLSRKCFSAENFVSILSTIRPKEISSGVLFFNESESFMIVFFFFFYLGFLSRTFTIHGTAGEGGGYLLTPLYHFQPLHRHLDISRATNAGNSPLHIAGSRTRTGNLWFSSASR